MKLLPIRLMMLLLVAPPLLLACSGSDDDDPAPAPPEPEPLSRTVLVYMAANNSPALPHQLNFDDIVEAVDSGALDGGGRLLVMRKTSSTAAPELLELTPEQQTVVKEYAVGDNTVDPDFMAGVIADARRLAPAADYGLILWSHASGWRSPSRSWGQDAQFTGGDREMSIPDLARALGSHQFSFIYMDCCFMGNIETLYELRNAAAHVIASATETPYAGMDYANNIPAMFAREVDLQALARNTYAAVASEARVGDNCGIAIALYDMAEVEAVADAVSAAYAANPGATVNAATIQQYGFSTWNNYFFDLRHYMATLLGADAAGEGAAAASGAAAANAALLDNLDQALARFIPAYYATAQIWQRYPLTNAHGVSVFIPGSSSYQTTYHYDELQWYRDVVAPYFSNGDGGEAAATAAPAA